MCFLFALLFTLATGRAAWSANPVSYVGDFNGDGWPDALLQPADPTAQVQIFLADGTGNLTIPGQSWSADYLGLHWSSDTSQLVIGDFTGNGRDDVLLQPLQPGGTGAVLLSDAKGQFHAVTQLIANPYLGLDWSAASHTLVVGDFTGNGRQNVLLQTAAPGGMNLIAEPNAQGVFNTTGQSWPDGYLGLQWSAQQVTLYVGDFTGNGQSDLLVQVNDPVSDTQVPAYALLLADATGEFTQINQSWGVSAFGADWSPSTHTLSIEDVTGSGVDSIVLMAKDPSGTNYLFLGNQTGTFSKPDLTWTGAESAKTAWANKMAAEQSIVVTGNTAQSSPSKSTVQTTAQPRTVTAQATQTANAVGTIGGESGVNGGAAAYTIPIVVPPGRAGMQPALSLSYSSRGGNGDVGMGWSLNGLSAITRCPATKAQDNLTQGVTYSATYDRLCLDGQHLIAVSGTYGLSGSVYRTELDSQVRVTLNGGSINSTGAYFEVDYQSGNKVYYGTATDSQFIASGQSVPLVWAIAQTEDLAGNNAVYNYTSYGSGEYHISSIVYTGTSSGITINSTGNREVDFTYTTRSDPSSVWLAGGETRQTVLLSQITTKLAGSEVRQWALNYSSSQATGRSLLSSVQECGYAPGSSSLSCLPPDTFTWQDAPLSFGAPVAVSLPSTISNDSGIDCTYSCTAKNQFYVYGTGDYDGDGVNERFYENLVTGTSAVFWLNDPSGTKLINFSSTFATQFTGQNQDFLSNGYADAIGDDSNHNVLVASCTAPPACTNVSNFTLTSIGISDANSILMTGQFAGDGLNDVLVVGNTPSTWNYNFTYYPNKTEGGDTVPSFTTPGVSLGTYAAGVPSGTSVIGDLDGNGIPDVLVSSGGVPMAVAFFSNTSGSPSTTSMTVKSVASLGIQEFCALNGGNPGYCTFADINGDGLADVVYVADDSGTGATPTWHYQLNEGGHFGPAVNTGIAVPTVILNTPGYFNNFSAFRVGDFTNDGKDEILVPVSRVSTYCLNLKVKLEGVYQPETICGDDLYGNAPLGGNYTGDDHSVYQFQILKFVEQTNGFYVPTWVTSGSSPVTLNGEAGMMEVGDVNGSGLTGIAMLSSKWYDDGAFNQPDTEISSDGCAVGATTPPCASRLGTGYYTMTPQGGAPDLMLSATNGLGAQAAWQYDSLTDLKSQGIYTVDQPCSTANISGQLVEYYCFTSSMWVVRSYSISNDVGTTNNYTYAYNDAVYENRGRGFQGFRQIAVTDQAAGTVTTNTYNQAFPLSGTLVESTVKTTSGTVLSDTTNTWTSASPVSCLVSSTVYWPELTLSTAIKNGTSGENISTTTTSYSYDGNDNPHTENTTVSDASGTYSSDTTNTYASPDCTDWWTDELQQKQVVLTANYQNPITSNPGSMTRTASYTYTALRKIQEEQDDVGSGFEKDTTYGYDSYGNATSVTLSSPLSAPGSGTLTGEQGFTSRTTQSDYSGTGGYLADSITNASGQKTQINPDPGTGLPLGTTDPNGVVIAYGYDAFGRKVSEQVTSPMALPATVISYTSPASVCAGTYLAAAYSVTTSRTGYPSQTVCHDLLGHELRTVTDGFASGQPSYADTRYDALGRVTFTSEPYFNGQTESGTTVNQYDVLNRMLKKTDAEGVVTTIGYSSLQATTTTTPPDSPAFTTASTTNALGKLLSTVDAKGSDTEFRYDAQGNPLLIQDAAGHQTLAAYNLLGQKTSVSDPDMGNWSYVYDALGNLLQQTDAKNQVIEQRYDNLGRMTSRTQPEGTTAWAYDSCTDGTGKLCNVTQYDGYQKTYSYDGDGRVSNVAEQINGAAYNTSTGYDSDGRVSTVSYPAGVTAAPPVADAGAAQTVWPNTTVTLNGSGSSDPNGLTLHYQWTQTGGPAVVLNGANTVTASFTSGAPGSVYSFQLTVTDGLTTATASTTVTVPTAPGSPTGLSIAPSPSTNGSYILSWSQPSSGVVTSYAIYESLNGGGYSEAGTTGASVTSYAFSGKGTTSANDTYTYYVAACNPSGCANSGAASVVVAYPPGVPGSVSVSPTTSTTGNYTVSWTAPSGVVSSYQIAESVNGGSYSVVASGISGTVTSYSFSGKGSLTSNNTYAYEVAACNYTATNCGNYSASASVLVTLPPTAPSSISLPSQSNWDSSFTVSYGAATGVSPTYHVDIGTYSSGQYQWTAGHCTSTTTSCNFTAGQVTLGTYYARVYACNQSACGNATQASNTITVWKLTPPGAPTLSAPSTVTSDSVPLSWSAPSTTTYYNLYRSLEKSGSFGAYTEVPNLTQTSYTDTFGALVQAAQYYVVACNQAGCGPNSNVTLTTVQLQGGCKTCTPTKSPSSTTAPPAGSASPPSGTGLDAADSTQLTLPVSATPPITPASTVLIAATRVDMDAPTAQPVTIAPSAVPQLALTAVSVPPPPVGATVPVAMAATPILREQNIIPTAIPVLPTLGTPYLTAGSSLAALAPAGASRLTLHDIQGSTSAAGAGVAASPSSSWRYGPTVSEYYAGLHLEPASSTTTQVGLTVLYTYTSTGYLQQLSNAVYPGQVFWTGNSEDAFGQISQETYGNGIVSTISHNDPLGRITGISSTSGSTTLQGWGYSWDALGNLVSRADNSSSGNVSESFGYDLLNRLTSAQVTNGSGAQPAITYGYDALGDITSKSDTGSYTYGSGAGPHAVTSISGPAGGSYSYDPDGNMTNRNGTTIVWNSDNLPVSITESSSNASSFAYAPDKHRYYQSAEINGVAETTVYAGAFEAVTTGGVTTYRYHLSADSREVAEVDLSNSGSSVVEKVSYVLTDHLGSTDVVQTTDVNGNVLSTTGMSFGAWGNRREANTWLPPVSSSEAQADHTADRYGFTHQEMLDNVGIIHMNGRIYDPNLGRFLSVDPVFEFPANTQSLNPYSYVLNNPLSMTDPTGYVAACGTGKANCPDSESGSVTVKTTAHDIDSHIAVHGQTTITTTREANGNTVQTASGNGFGMGETAEVTVGSHGGGNGAQNSSQGPGTGQALGNSSNQGANTAPAASGNVAQANAVTNAQTQSSQEKAKLINAENAAIDNPRFQPSHGVTHCNQALCYVAKAMGAPVATLTDIRGNALLANVIRANLAKSGSGYHQVTAQEAQQLANKGVLVIVTGPGHVSAVAPDTGQKLPGYGPIIANVGYRNGDLHLDYVFTKNDMPNVRFYTPNQ